MIPGLGGGGAERILTGLANRWVRRGDEVTIVTVDDAGHDAYPLDAAVGRVALELVGRSHHLLEGALQGVRRARAMRRALGRVRPDAVVSFIRSANVLALLSCAGTGVPVFVSERTDPRLDPGVRRQPAWAAIRRVLYPRATGVVVQTESVARWARAFVPRVHVIPNFVERPDRMATPGQASGPRRLCAVGRLGPEKGFDLLVEAFASVAPRHPDWSLAILGEGTERRRLEALVRARGVGERVALPGRVADPSVQLADAHLFALPSRREGFPNALLEAMAVGLPAVAFDCRSGPGEIVRNGENGLLVPDGDVAALTAALDRLMSSAAERERLGRAAREVASVYAPERIFAAWDALVRKEVRA